MTRSLTQRARAAWRVMAAPLSALALALAIGAVIMAASHVSPTAGYASLLRGAFGSSQAIGRTLQTATPLILTGLAVAFAFQGGLFNIGGDGQFTAGAVTVAWAGVSLSLPGRLGLIVVLVLGALAGAFVGAIAGFLKAQFQAHEVVVTIMLNFIVSNLATWLLLHPLSAGTDVPGSKPVRAANSLPTLSADFGGLHAGLFVALLAAALAWLFLWRTARGLELRISGLAPQAARFAGLSRVSGAVVALAGGGAFAGLAGAGEVLGTYGNMTVPFVTDLGFLGIGVALLGRNNPFGCIFGGIVLGALSAGGQQMQFDLGISAHLSEVLVGVVLLFVTVRVVRTRDVGNRAAVPDVPQESLAGSATQ